MPGLIAMSWCIRNGRVRWSGWKPKVEQPKLLFVLREGLPLPRIVGCCRIPLLIAHSSSSVESFTALWAVCSVIGRVTPGRFRGCSSDGYIGRRFAGPQENVGWCTSSCTVDGSSQCARIVVDPSCLYDCSLDGYGVWVGCRLSWIGEGVWLF